MQINNNMQPVNSTSFGMALKITPAAREALQNSTMETIQKLQKIGQDLKETKHYHLEIGKNLTPRIDSDYAPSYLPPFRVVEKPIDGCLNFKCTWDGTNTGPIGPKRNESCIAMVKFANKEAALEAYSKLNSMPSDLDKAAELTKLLDNRQVEMELKEAAKRENALKIAKAVDELMEQFGAEAHIKP